MKKKYLLVKGQWSKVKSLLGGQTLIETVTALAVVIILVSSLVTVSIASVRSATLTSNKITAAQLAYQQLEQVRTARDSTYTWSAFTSLFDVGGPCLSSGTCFTSCTSSSCVVNTSGSGSYSSGGTTFAISIFGSFQADGVHANSVVSWTDSLGIHNERLSTIFTNWR